MKIYVYLDESGSIHKNSRTKFFAVGGYFAFLEDKNKVVSLYKKINKKIKDTRHISLEKELKSYDLEDLEKVDIFSQIQEVNTFCGCVKVFLKEAMKKEIIESNIFFNYAVRLLFKDCIFPLLSIGKLDSCIEFIVSVDNRNIRVGDLKNLETYLNTEFCLEGGAFKVTYYDSASNYGIQLADLIVNTFYNLYKDKTIVKRVMPVLKGKNFRIGVFPGHKIRGRRKKITYNKKENS